MSDKNREFVSITVTDVFGVGKLVDSKTASRLIDAICSGVSRFFGPWFLERDAKTLLDLQEKASASLSPQFSGEITLDERAALRIQFEQTRKQQNREIIARRAIEILQIPPSFEEGKGEIEESWLDQYWQKAECVSHPDMQVLWAKVLCRKCLAPNEVSPRTLAVLGTMTFEEARMVESLAPFILGIEATIAGFSSVVGGTVTSFGQYQGTVTVPHDAAEEFKRKVLSILPDTDRVRLDAAGVMQSANGWASEYSVEYFKSLHVSIGTSRFVLDDLPAPNDRYAKHYHLGAGSGFTQEGFDLVRISGVAANVDFVKAFRTVVQSANCRFYDVIDG